MLATVVMGAMAAHRDSPADAMRALWRSPARYGAPPGETLRTAFGDSTLGSRAYVVVWVETYMEIAQMGRWPLRGSRRARERVLARWLEHQLMRHAGEATSKARLLTHLTTQWIVRIPRRGYGLDAR